MGANILYTATKRGTDLTCSAPSSFIESMNKAFGHFPCDLDESDISTLKGMASCAGIETYDEIIEALEKHKEIRVFAVY